MSQGDPNYTVDEYQLIQPPIASGSSSQVWEVSTAGDPTHFAMKILLPEALADLEQVAVLKHEGKVGKQFDHPNIIRFHKVVAKKQHAYIVMDYFRSPNLKVQIGSDCVGVQARIRKLVEGLCLAIGHMHEKGWIHRDLKPDNILFSKSSEMRLVDFSLSTKHASGIGKMFAGKITTVQGTRTYIAPETIQKQHPSPQTDMYSLGVTLFEVLTAQPPFRGANPTDLLKKHVNAKPPNPSDFNPNVTPEMDKFVLRMLAKKPKDRHKTMDEVFAEFRSLKVFKEDVHEQAERKEKELAAKNKETFDGRRVRLSSRNDAERTDAATATALESGAAPATAAAKAPVAPAPAAPAPRPPVQPPAPVAMGRAMPAGPPPAMMPPPGYAPAGYQPAFAPAGMQPAAYARGYPPGYFPPGYPQGAPPQAAPGQPAFRPPMPVASMPAAPSYARPGMPAPNRPPSSPAAWGAPPAPMPGAPQGVAPGPNAARAQLAPVPRPAVGRPPAPVPVPAAAGPTTKPDENPDDLPLMEELPPIV